MLAKTLRSINTAQDTAALFHLLGYTPENHPWEEGTVVARWRGFRVVAADHPAPVQRARILAKRLAAGSERALAVVVGGGEMALAAPRIGVPDSSRVLTLTLASPSPFALLQLEALRPQRSASALAHSLRVAELLASEAAGRRFFAAFRVCLERLAGSIDRRHTEADRRMATLLALTRVLFLYFVQAKGWLDGRPDYLRTTFDTTLARRKHFHRAVLHPLFFGTLNRPLDKRHAVASLGRIPYLNGGLFEPHPVERRIGPVTFSNLLWRDAFDGLFERFRFCVREAEEVDAIAPDMLGHVFERVMADDERHATGTFYTPEAVVRKLVDATIEAAVTGLPGIDPALAGRIIELRVEGRRSRAAADTALANLRILDPAAGSGAFLLVALERLTDMRSALDDHADDNTRRRLRRSILRHNLFGVDISPVAVRLAELRLWLAVVADDQTTCPEDVTPLPNLDGVVRQGDALLDPVAAARAAGATMLPSADVAAFRSARDVFFEARGEARRGADRALRSLEERLARAALDGAEQVTNASLADLVTAARGRDLFGGRAGFRASQRDRYRELRNRRSALRKARRELDDGQLPFFAFEVHAADVIAAGGFSAVIGNPPWVRAERLDPERRHLLRERFSWWRAGPGRGYRHQPDLAVAFLQRAVELTRPGGAVGMLVPSKLASSDYGERARTSLARETRVTCAYRVPDSDAAGFGATTYPLGLVIKKVPPQPADRVRIGPENAAVSQGAWQQGGPWVLVPDAMRDALETFRASGDPLGEVAAPRLGVKTGADAVLVGRIIRRQGETVVLRFPTGDVTLEASMVRPALRGRDVRSFRAEAVMGVVWGHDGDGRPLPALPPLAAAHVHLFEDLLRQRADFRRDPVWCLFRVAKSLSGHRLVWPDLIRRPSAFALMDMVTSPVPLNTCYVATLPDREATLAGAAVFGSTWTNALVSATADEACSGYRRLNAHVAARIPLPRPGPARAALAALSASAHETGSVQQDALDDAVASALDLPPRCRDALRRLANDHR